MRNAALEETQAGIKVAGRNLNNLRYADDTTLMEESEEELPRIRGQGQQLVGATPRPRSGGCVGAGVPRGAIPR